MSRAMIAYRTEGSLQSRPRLAFGPKLAISPHKVAAGWDLNGEGLRVGGHVNI